MPTASPTFKPRGLRFAVCWMEMSNTVRPVTSFLIEDILSIKDSTGFNGKRTERCSQWKEESEKLSVQLCPQETTLRVQTGELLQVFLSVNGFECMATCAFDFDDLENRR